MSQLPGSDQPMVTSDLHELLLETLRLRATGSVTLVGIDRRPSAKRSSFALEEIDVRLGDGTSLQLIFKDLSTRALSRAARCAKPSFLYDPLREIAVYRSVLADREFGTAICYGAVVDGEAGRYGLLLERVAGEELHQEGDWVTWCRVARWLAAYHDRVLGDVELPAGFPKCDGDFYRVWPRRALECWPASRVRQGRSGRLRLKHLVARYDRVVEYLLALPVTLIHGEFYASNVLVQRVGEGLRICPVDWEMAALGPGLIDLAALAAGKWTEEAKTQLARDYHSARFPTLNRAAGTDGLLTDLAYCRLHLAMQWLGWSPNWSPPPDHAYDWLAEAFTQAERLQL